MTRESVLALDKGHIVTSQLTSGVFGTTTTKQKPAKSLSGTKERVSSNSIVDLDDISLSDKSRLPNLRVKSMYFDPSMWENPQHFGYINKQGQIHKAWKKRWFVLKNTDLFYFR